MRTVRQLIYRDVFWSVFFVAVAFMSLFFFIDFVDELRDVGSRGYSAAHAAAYSLLHAPAHLYELMPIAVLIGTTLGLFIGRNRVARAASTCRCAIGHWPAPRRRMSVDVRLRN